MESVVKNGLIRLFLIVLATAVFHQAYGQEAPGYVMRIAIGNPEQKDNYGWSTFEVLKNEVDSSAGGRLSIELYSQVMGKSSLEMIELVRDSVVQARDFADGHLATIYPPIQVFSIPYLFAAREIAWRVLDGPFGQRLIEDMAQKTGLRPLYWIENGGFRHFSNNKRAIHSPADMQGLKIRTMESPLQLKIVSDLGGRGVPIDWGNVYEAIAAGIVDGQENSINTFLIPHLENIQNHIVLDGHVYAVYTLLINDSWYQGLPDDVKEILNRAKRVSAMVNRGLCMVNEMDAIKYLQSKNISIYMPTPEEKEQFRQLTQASAVAWLRANVGSEWVDGILEATKKAEKELGYDR